MTAFTISRNAANSLQIKSGIWHTTTTATTKYKYLPYLDARVPVRHDIDAKPGLDVDEIGPFVR